MKNVTRSIILLFLCMGIATPMFSRTALNLYGKASLPFGEYTKYVSVNVGGGIGAELDPFFVPNLGTSLHADFQAGILKDKRIKSIWDLSFYGGIWYRLNWGSFAFQPELNYGVCIHKVTMTPGWYGPEDMNLDQMLQFAPAFRWTPGAKLNSTTAIDIAPCYTLLFEKDNLIHQLGLRIGLTYALN